jgi:hypothetical protein
VAEVDNEALIAALAKLSTRQALYEMPREPYQPVLPK